MIHRLNPAPRLHLVALRGSLVLALCCSSVSADAQERVYRSLFGGATTDASATQTLDLSGAVAEGYDTNVLAQQGQGQSSPLGPQIGGSFTSLMGNLQYALKKKYADLSVNGGSDFRYFTSLHKVAPVRHSFGAGASIRLGAKTTSLVNGSLSYTPSYLYGLFARATAPALGETIPAATDYGVTDRRSRTSMTTASITRSIARRSTLDVSGAYQQTVFMGRTVATPDLSSYNAGTHFSHRMSRDATLRLGYDFRRATYRNNLRPEQHDIGVGIDYDRALSKSRRTRLRFSFGSSVLDGPLASRPSAGAVKQLRAVGNVLLTQQMGRTWTARAAYRRGAQFIEDVSGPVFSDAVTVTASGFLNRRTDVITSASYTNGAVIGRTESAFTTYTANAGLRVGLNRTLAATVDYLYYFYDFRPGAGFTPGLPPRIGRNSIRAGLTLWLPLIRN